MIPVTPAFLTVVLAGCVAIARWAGAWRFVVLVAPRRRAAGRRGSLRRAPSSCGAQDRRRRGRRRGRARAGGLGALRLDRHHGCAVLVVRLRPPGEHPRPPRCAARLLRSARRRRLVRARAEPFLHGPPRSGTASGSSMPRRRSEAAAGANARFGVEPVDGHYFVVRSPAPAAPRALIREGLALREALAACGAVQPARRRAADGDRQLLAGTCVPYGELGDPDISPHWPPVATSHQ